MLKDGYSSSFVLSLNTTSSHTYCLPMDPLFLFFLPLHYLYSTTLTSQFSPPPKQPNTLELMGTRLELALLCYCTCLRIVAPFSHSISNDGTIRLLSFLGIQLVDVFTVKSIVHSFIPQLPFPQRPKSYPVISHKRYLASWISVSQNTNMYHNSSIFNSVFCLFFLGQRGRGGFIPLRPFDSC